MPEPVPEPLPDAVHDDHQLGALQAWVQAVIRHPDGPRAGARSPEATRGLGREAAVGELVAPSTRLSPEERIGLYHRGYHLRLLECLRVMHPALRHCLGADLFDGFALDYLGECPSTSRSLFELNANFAGYLEAHRPDRDRPDEVWPDFLVDLARLERLFLEVYDGPGTEGARLPGAGDLGYEPGEVVVALAPCVRVLRSRFPVGDYLVAVRAGEEPPLPFPRPTALALTRRDYQVVVVPLDADEFALLEALEAGIGLLTAARAAGCPAARAWRRLRRWADAGLVASVSAAPRPLVVPAPR